jgi:hypothetical protein
MKWWENIKNRNSCKVVINAQFSSGGKYSIFFTRKSFLLLPEEAVLKYSIATLAH